ncbi:Global nitrogen regulator [compost metagenome]
MSGLVKTYNTDSFGHETNLSFLKERDVLPRSEFLARGVYPVSAAAIVRTQLLVLPLEPFLQFLAQNPGASINMLHALQQSISEMQDRLREKSWPGVQNPGQLFLLKLAEHYGQQSKGKLRIGIPMSHDHFANVIGTTRHEGDRLLQQLEAKGIAEMKRWGFVIHDVDALRHWRDSEQHTETYKTGEMG